MASLIEHYANVSDVVLADYHSRRAPERDIFLSRFLRPLLPAAIRLGTGHVIDRRDRIVGPLDNIGCSDSYPLLGEGQACQFLADGVAFCLQVRNWKKDDLTQFADMAREIKALERRSPSPIFCAAVSVESLPAAHVADFLKSSAGASVDGVLSIGEHAMIRNTLGWYGETASVPFVTARGSGESLKALAFLLLHLCQNQLGVPFTLSDYQHL